MTRRLIRLILKMALFLVQAALIVFVTLIFAGAFAARHGPDLENWHTFQLDSEFRAGSSVHTLDDYILNEQQVFEELEREVISHCRSWPHWIMESHLPCLVEAIHQIDLWPRAHKIVKYLIHASGIVFDHRIIGA